MEQIQHDTEHAVKTIKLTKAKSIEMIKTHLNPFITKETETIDVINQNIGIFLLPEAYLLMKTTIRQKSIFISIRTSMWQILKSIDTYFDHISKTQ